MVEELVSFLPLDLADLDMLMRELSVSSSCEKKVLSAALNDPNVHVYIIRVGGHIVATGTLCVKHTLEFAIADIESVVVSSSYRGKGYGKMLMAHIIEVSKSQGIHHIQLTSNSKRVVANKLYQDMGFEKYDTNFYIMAL